ncbi:hypothetical protein ACHAWU_006871 [Discostella pseudostelligera]|uniref:Uncharacterized protein n=1 Tax=Discostella pseudostelligera TaxID=259834 RepID=A0ABD3MXX3_9STRA
MNMFGRRNANATLSAPNLTETTSDNEGVVGEKQKQRDGDADDGLECTTIAKTNTESNQLQQQEPTTDIEEEILSDTRKNSLNADPLMRIVSTVLPKVEPLPWPTFFCLSIWCTVPAAVYILLFTQMGFGESFYYALSNEFGGYASIFAAFLLIFGFFFYILDIGEWNTAVGNIVRGICMTVMFIAFVIAVMLVSNEHPVGLISLFPLFNPVWMLLVKSLFYRERDARRFVSGLSGPLLLVSLCTLTAFIVWIVWDDDNQWNSVTKVEAAVGTGCQANFDDYPNCENEDGSGGTCFSIDYSTDPQELVFPENCDRLCLNVYSDCSNGFILWCGPVLMCLSLLFLSFFCTFLRAEGTEEKDVFNFGNMWLVVLFILWASASLSGTAAGVSTSLFTITLASLAGSFIFLSASFNYDEQKQTRKAFQTRIHEKYGDSVDIARGLFIVTCFPIVIVYFCLAALNQMVRKIGINPCAQPAFDKNSPEEKAGFVTTRAMKQLTRLRSWNRAKVLTYAVYWGIAFMTMQVLVANLTVVFFSWMIMETANMGLLAVTGIMSAVGVIMFLFPPVPGMPVYLALGIVLTAQGHALLGWTGSIAYSSAVGLVVKLVSGVIQQKVFGESLSHYVKVRQFVGINSTLMKALRLVVGKNGLSLPKVAILIGGPEFLSSFIPCSFWERLDWPTSVLCGIMRLSILQIMLGTLPVIVLIIPSCLTGSLLYMASLVTDTGNPVFDWAGTLSTITASVTAVVQFASMIVAAYYLEQASDKYASEISAIDDDIEVKEADARDEHVRECYKKVTQWNALPMAPKLLLSCSLASITASCYMVQLFDDLCFVEHTLTDSIEENLGGNVGNLFLPLGWAAVGLFVGSIVLLYMFTSWGKNEAKKLAKSEKLVPMLPPNSPRDYS